jgi:hypothetical protein
MKDVKPLSQQPFPEIQVTKIDSDDSHVDYLMKETSSVLLEIRSASKTTT